MLLDLNLPDSHGAETFRKVLEIAPNVPIVILSGQADEALAIKALHQGVQDYLVKGAFTSGALNPSSSRPLPDPSLSAPACRQPTPTSCTSPSPTPAAASIRKPKL